MAIELRPTQTESASVDAHRVSREVPLPVIIQGGMGVAVSSWPLARAVALTGQLGVVSGTALDVVLARRLQDGDAGGHLRRAIGQFPVPAIGDRILARYFRPNGRTPGQSYLPIPKPTLHPTQASTELAVVGNFAEVWRAKVTHSSPAEGQGEARRFLFFLLDRRRVLVAQSHSDSSLVQL